MRIFADFVFLCIFCGIFSVKMVFIYEYGFVFICGCLGQIAEGTALPYYLKINLLRCFCAIGRVETVCTVSTTVSVDVAGCVTLAVCGRLAACTPILFFERIAGFVEVGAVGVAAVELLLPAFYKAEVGGGVTDFVVFVGGEFAVEVGHFKCLIFRIILRHEGYMDVWRDVVGYVFQGVDGVFDVVGQD